MVCPTQIQEDLDATALYAGNLKKTEGGWASRGLTTRGSNCPRLLSTYYERTMVDPIVRCFTD